MSGAGSIRVGCPTETLMSHLICSGCTCGAACGCWLCGASSQLVLLLGGNGLHGSKSKMSKDQFAAPIMCSVKGQGDVGGQSPCTCRVRRLAAGFKPPPCSWRRVSGKAKFLPLLPLKNAGSLWVMGQDGPNGEETWTPMQITAGLSQGWLYRCEHQFPCPLPAHR